jgi:tRNA(fMet)-specific endonuclease VapC
MIVLDTDTLTLLVRQDSPSRQKILERLADAGPGDLATTVVTYEEQTLGWMKYKAKARTILREVEAYGRLRKHLDNYRSLIVLDFDASAADEFQQLKGLKLRVGTMDLKIASIVKVRGATLLTRNVVDFKRVPGLSFENWAD